MKLAEEEQPAVPRHVALHPNASAPLPPNGVRAHGVRTGCFFPALAMTLPSGREQTGNQASVLRNRVLFWRGNGGVVVISLFQDY